jgi:hypothetical protein
MRNIRNYMCKYAVKNCVMHALLEANNAALLRRRAAAGHGYV